jgi:hypothetical protein
MKRINQCGTSVLRSRPRLRAAGVMECWSNGVLEYYATDHFCGLGLELFARTVINSETVLPKAGGTAGKLMPRFDVGVASAASPRRAATISLERRVVSKQ